MKTKHLLAALAAASAAFSPAESAAATYDISIETTPVWSNNNNPSSNALQMAVSSGKLYTLDILAKKMYYTNGSTWKSFAVDVTIDASLGCNPGLAVDKGGHIIYHYNNKRGETTAARYIRILPKGATSEDGKTDIATGIGTSARADYMSASNDVISGTGYLWFFPNGNTNPEAIQIKNGTTAKKITFTGGTKVAAITTSLAKNVKGHPTTELLLEYGGSSNAGYTYSYSMSIDDTNATGTLTNESKVYNTAKNIGAFLSTIKYYKDPDRYFYIYPVYENQSGWTFTKAYFEIYDIVNKKTYRSPAVCSGDLSAKNGGSGLQLEAVWGGDSDPESVYIYCYKVGVGAWKYKVNVKKVTLDAPVLNAATVTVSEDRDSYGQQDAKLTWTGIDNAASYKVYADGSLLATVTGTTYTESDITKSRTYYVQAVDASGVDGEKSNEVTATYTTPLAAPTLTYTYVLNSTNSPGRQDSKLTWNSVSGASKYRIYDVPNSGETATVTITTTSYTFINLKQNHTYYVAALNSDGIPGKKSNEVTTDIDFTIPHIPEWSDATGELEGYGMVNLSWNYTYGFEPDAYDIYRDGNLIVSDYNELLYVDEFVAEGDHTYKLKSVYYSDKTAKTRKSMTAESSEKTINVSARNNSYELYGIQEIYNYDISSSTAFGNGTVNTLSGFTTGENFRQGVFRDGYWYIAANAAGQILRFNADAGSLSSMASSATSIYSYKASSSAGLAIDDAGTFFLRLSSATSATSGDHFGSNLGTGILIPFTYKDKAATTAGTPTYVNINSGRCDYYAMKGDALGGTGHVYLALNGSPAYWDVTITNGAVAGTVTGASGQAIGYNNYIFPLAGRDDLIHCVRSDAYYNVKQGVSSTKIYSSYSRRNNSGGISAWFNNDLILITPQSLSSTPYGDFIVAKGYRDVSSSDPKPTDVLLDPEHIVPLAAVTQANSQKASVSSYVNSCWFGVTAHDTGDDAQDPYLDIYVYSPGLRFAKYRLYPYATLPDPKVTFTGQVNTGEVDGKDYEEITSLSGTVTWQKVDMGEEGHYGLEGFKVELADDTKNVIATAYVNSDGYACADESFSSPSGKSLLDGSTYTKVFEDLTAQEYAATVTAIYDKKTDSFTYTSEPVSGHVDNNYEAPAPTVYANSTVMVYSDKNSPAWPDPDDPAKYRTNRRIDINFDAPQFDGEENPRSYYQVWYKKPGQADYQQLTGFTVVTGEHDSGNASSARRRADSSDSDTNDVSEVPGNYDFDNKGTVADSSSPAVVSLYYQPEVTSDGTFVDASDDPTTWSYKVNATYAASNEAITKVSEAEAVTGQNGGVTGVELPVVEAVMNESVYPAVTRTTFTASSVDAISAVTVYAADGSVAMTIDGGGQSRLTVDASALTPGVYFVSINGHKAHKLVKR